MIEVTFKFTEEKLAKFCKAIASNLVRKKGIEKGQPDESNEDFFKRWVHDNCVTRLNRYSRDEAAHSAETAGDVFN